VRRLDKLDIAGHHGRQGLREDNYRRALWAKGGAPHSAGGAGGCYSGVVGFVKRHAGRRLRGSRRPHLHPVPVQSEIRIHGVDLQGRRGGDNVGGVRSRTFAVPGRNNSIYSDMDIFSQAARGSLPVAYA